MFALVDCNNFYASCETIFKPQLIGQPVIVLSNNDGCVIARSAEAKALGIPMGIPVFKIQSMISQHQIHVFSSNFALYGDISQRVMSILKTITPDVEVYSIDEAFLQVPSNQVPALGPSIRNRIKQELGVSVGIGFGSTKTLAKLANTIAKTQSSGVMVINKDNRDALFSAMSINEVWGIGRNHAKRLARYGVKTIADFVAMDITRIRSLLGINGCRTYQELMGVSCLTLDMAPSPKKSIVSSRSFGRTLYTYDDLSSAVNHNVVMACHKLRQSKQVAAGCIVFIQTSQYRDDRYAASITIQFDRPTASELTIMPYLLDALKSIVIANKPYSKSGVILVGLTDHNEWQLPLINAPHPDTIHNERLVTTVIDQLNARWGRQCIVPARFVLNQSKWKMNQSSRSPRYTTSWYELPIARCA